MILARKRLLARLDASEPRLVRLFAPAGYGKTSLARLLTRRFDRHALCDCSDVSGTVAFASRAMSALAEESQGSGDAIALARLWLHATESDAAAWRRALLEAWKMRQERSLFVIENADAVAGDDGVRALLGDLLAARPMERVLLISSRVELPLRVSDYLAPHQTLTLSERHMRLDGEDAFGIFEGTDLAAEVVERIVRLAGGWPIALLLLARVAHYEANIERLLDRLDGVPFAERHEYIVNEVLSALTPDMMSTMLAVAAIPHASLEDISVATGIRHATPVIDGLLRLPGFITSEAGSYHMHPLLRAALRARHEPDFADYLLRAARENERLGDLQRAAELFSISGDDAAAANALDRLPAASFEQPSPRLIDALAKIPLHVLCSYPNLWIALLRFRRLNVSPALLDEEARGLLEAPAVKASPALHRRLSVRRATLALGLEHLEEARAALETAGSGGSFEDSPEEQRLVLMTSAVVASKQGRFADSDRYVERADAVQGARHLRFELERAQIAMEKARFSGDWPSLLKIGEEALGAAQRGGPTSRIVAAARAVASAAWYCNDDDRVAAAEQMLEDCGESSAPAPAVAAWRAALESADIDQAKALFDDAIDAIERGENDFLRIATRVSAALLLPAERRRLLEARAIAQHIESPPLQASIELLIDSAEPSDYGIFKNVAARVARSPLKIRRDVLFLDVVRGQVRRGAEVLHVSDRGFELLVALALLPSGASRELAAEIWPALDPKAALNSLKMCVSRTRAQVDKEAIQSTRNGYALSDRVVIDVREFERLLRSLRGAETLGDSMRRRAQEALAALSAHPPAYAEEWHWFAPHAAHLESLEREFFGVLAKDALRGTNEPAPPAAPFAEFLAAVR
jgi:ATP/maltotriose-dependent transcriptional regulator MalT